jgi:hypothetical protein
VAKAFYVEISCYEDAVPLCAKAKYAYDAAKTLWEERQRRLDK